MRRRQNHGTPAVERRQTEDLALWGTVLWKKHRGIPDNYTGDGFLASLISNDSARVRYSYGEVVRSFSRVAAHMSAILVFISVYVLLHEDRLSSQTIATGTFAVGFWGYLSALYKGMIERGKARKTLKAVFLLLTWLILLTPILRTCAKDTANDTIFTLCSGLFLLNMAFHDYSPSEKIPGPVSLNSAIFASTLLASRLPSDHDAFALMLFAVELFALFPIISRPFPFQVILVLGLLVSGIYASIAPLVVVIYLLALVGLLGIAPMWFMALQRCKINAGGRWDEAVLENGSPGSQGS